VRTRKRKTKEITPKDDTETFNTLRKNKNYTELGWWFWGGFTDDSRRSLLCELWEQLTKDEQEKCEEL
jgi:hypothetical protein